MKIISAVTIALMAMCAPFMRGEINVSFNAGAPGVELARATIVTDPADGPTVETVAGHFADDIELVTGSRPTLATALPHKGTAVVAGTADSKLIKGLIDTKEIENGTERFIIKSIDKPVKALVVAGSDRRAVAYGLFTVSEAIGVSPWYWWADVPVERHGNAVVEADHLSKEPSVRYRGIFINDEDWGLKPWASLNYEKELGDIGPRTYAKICELILRLKGNMMAPAMHSCTGAFYTHPESKEVVDRYGIMITTSHCEPVGFNNACKDEWDTARDGEWNYSTNRDAILAKLDSRVKEAAPYGNIYTLAMRGLHDEGMRGDMTEAEKVKNLARAIADQRDLLKKYVKKPLDEIPQIFVPYKEALDMYELGLEVPEEVTLVWVDDNYGFMKRLSDPEERKRKGGAGVYYHTSYLGTPHDYLWLNTTPPALMYEELKKAHDTGADRYWLLNVGDIKPMETAMATFFDMAWDFDRFSYGNANRHQAGFLAGIYGKEYEETFQKILDTYYRLAWSRKPEYMGWEWEWDSKEHDNIGDTEFSFDNHNDARKRLADYDVISYMASDVMDRLPEEKRASFFEMVGYPVMASCQMNRKFLMSHLNHELVAKGDYAGANRAALESKAAYDSINALNHRYNKQVDGKWDHMMAVPPGFCAKYQMMPSLTVTPGVEPGSIDILPTLDQAGREGYKVVDLASWHSATGSGLHAPRVIEGIGYDWKVLQLGEAMGESMDPTVADVPRTTYEFGPVTADSVEVTVWTLPFFPLHKGKSTRIGVTVDGAPVEVLEYLPQEWSTEWKANVLRNGMEFKRKFAVDPGLGSHTLTFTTGDPGMIVQRAIIDWGGLKPTYVGPEVDN
jgi:hypothetical protein